MTPKELELVHAIRDYQAEHGVTPSYGELAVAVGLRSKSGVLRMLNALRDQGVVTWTAHTRSIVLIADAISPAALMPPRRPPCARPSR